MRRVVFCVCGLLASVAALSGSLGAERPESVEVCPKRIDDILTNPNVGFADFHMGWHVEDAGLTAEQCSERRGLKWPENYPATAVAYFRWYWSQLEPESGKIDFDYIDRRMQAANRTGQTLAFRVISIKTNGAGIPDWLRKQVGGVEVDGTFWPDYRDPVFQQAHRRFVQALAKRYNDHPALDHMDIGPVGCWGEWNTACTQQGGSLIEVYGPKDDAARDAVAAGYRQVVADYADAFTETPLVMLAIGADGDQRMIDVMGYALKRGTGWRVDCWGDWELFSKNWSHHGSIYPDFMKNARQVYPALDDVWKHAPIELEVCGTMPDWENRGWTADAPDGFVYKTFQFALDHHAAVLNAKRTPIPNAYVPAMNDLLRKSGYRYVIDRLTHSRVVKAGGELDVSSTWANLGTTPSYTRRTLAHRLHNGDKKAEFTSAADVRKWLPGRWEMQETFRLPKNLPAGVYRLEVAILDRAGTKPDTKPLPPLQLGIAGRAADGWYPLSELTVE